MLIYININIYYTRGGSKYGPHTGNYISGGKTVKLYLLALIRSPSLASNLYCQLIIYYRRLAQLSDVFSPGNR